MEMIFNGACSERNAPVIKDNSYPFDRRDHPDSAKGE